MKYLVLSLFFIISWETGAQTFTHTSSIPAVEKDAFYRITVSPDMGSYLNSGHSNVRLFDQAGKEVPFLMEEESPVYSKQEFRSYAILEKKIERGCCTSLVFKNPGRNLINNISLEIKNAEVFKEATLVGSDDQRQWYALKEHFFFNSIDNNAGTAQVNIVNFPLSNYRYYSLRINDSTTAPLNIISVGAYDTQTEIGKYTEIQGIKFSTADSTREKQTYVRFLFGAERFIDKIELSLSGAPYFRRRANLYEPRIRTLRKGRQEMYNEFVQSLELSSTHSATLSFSPNTKFKELIMVIENDDNPSLSLNSVTAYQLNRYLTAWLKKGDSYTLKFGKDLAIPSYDLVFFKDSIPENPPAIQAASILPVQVTATQDQHSPVFFTSNTIIWVAIVLVISVLGFMSIKMVRETNSREEEK